jgi:hypothetical protein
VADIARAAAAASASWAGAPDKLEVDGHDTPPSADWIDRWVDGRRRVSAGWQARTRYLAVDADRVVKLSDQRHPRDVAAVHALLARLPFALASFATTHLDWIAPPQLYAAPRFSADHFQLGWGCAFRGRGHDDLVSRRWLDHGPWQLVRQPDDLSIVQFHTLEDDSATALAQARPAHQRMGYSPTGGFLLADHEATHPLSGLYLPAHREHRIVIAHREVSELEMFDACTARRFARFPNPVERVTYVFADEANARRHLHELWLRELGCLAIIAGKDVRLDETYAPG